MTHVRLLGSPVSGRSLAGEAWPRPYRHPRGANCAGGRGMASPPQATQRGANCAGGRGMASPLQAPNAEPIALAGEAWPRPHRRPNAEPIALAGEAWPRPYRHPTRSQLRWRARHGPAPTGDPTWSQLRRGEAMPRPPASNRGCPDPVSQVMNQHTTLDLSALSRQGGDWTRDIP